MDDAPILICYDDSSDARHAITEAAVLFGDRKAVVLDVAPFLTVAESYAALAPTTLDFEATNTEAAFAHARVGAEFARRAGFTAEARADAASPTWDGIVEIADEIGAAAIVIGSRGLTGARELLHGSLSHQVAERAGRPVLIVPPPHSRATRAA
jgi:nucleotide-binding universal stress UspA family protein